MIAEYYNGLNRAERRDLVLRVAKDCHLHPNTASLYLRGKKQCGPLVAEKIAEMIGQPVSTLFLLSI